MHVDGAASIPSVVPAKTSNAALPATGTAVPASKTDKAIILLLVASIEALRKL